jgi:hypothetical protein
LPLVGLKVGDRWPIRAKGANAGGNQHDRRVDLGSARRLHQPAAVIMQAQRYNLLPQMVNRLERRRLFLQSYY